jgi:DnaJ-class molecular chaperone
MSRSQGPFADGSGELPALEQSCEDCGGAGQVPGKKIGNMIQLGGRCETCRGAGTILTEEGRRLIGFLRRHMQ